MIDQIYIISTCELASKGVFEMFTDFSKTYCDTCAGNGNLVLTFLNRRLENCLTDEDIFNAISTIYAVELMQDNVDEMKKRIKSALTSKYQEIHKDFFELIKYGNFMNGMSGIIDHNIVCSDFFKWDFDNWKPISEQKSKELF